MGRVRFDKLSTVKSVPNYSLGAKCDRNTQDETAPGPGTYPQEAYDTKLARSAEYSIPSCPRVHDKKLPDKWQIPAPGTHTLPQMEKHKDKAPSFAFGSQARFKAKSDTQLGPGRYNPWKSDFDRVGNNRGVPFGGKWPELQRSASAPGPGTHNPDYTQIEEKTVFSAWGNEKLGEDHQLRESARRPGPGQYPLLYNIHGTCVTKRQPAHTFVSRRKVAGNDIQNVPGRPVNETHYSVFGR